MTGKSGQFFEELSQETVERQTWKWRLVSSSWESISLAGILATAAMFLTNNDMPHWPEVVRAQKT